MTRLNPVRFEDPVPQENRIKELLEKLDELDEGEDAYEEARSEVWLEQTIRV